MKIRRHLLPFILAGSFVLAGCDQMGGSAPVAIIDLAAVAQATGQDEIMQMKADAAREELAQQLQQVAAELDGQIMAEREKMGGTPTAEQEQQLQLMTMQARQQLGDVQAQAQSQANQIDQELVDGFRAEIIPLAQQVASGLGAKVVLADDSYVVWIEPSLNITDQVIAAWQARPVAEEAAEEIVEEAAMLEEELQEVEAELAETEAELDDLKEEVAEGASEEVAEEVAE